MKKKTEEKSNNVETLQYAVGRRKRAVARVRMYSGNGSIVINQKPAKDYVQSEAKLKEFMKPLEVSGLVTDYDFSAKVIGGGVAGQVEAVQHGIARCIAKINEDLKKSMSQGGFLKRDPREKERKKVYHLRARKSPQFSKR
jgi:small subunit ribosomal protein S9